MKNLIIGILLIATPAMSADTFAVGTAVAQRDAVAYGALDVPAASDAATSIPVVVVNGAKDGPVVAFVAGSHGTEYTSIIALTRLASRIDPAKLKGTVIVAPLINVASFEQMTVHTNPIDRQGTNGQDPGAASRTPAERALARS